MVTVSWVQGPPSLLRLVVRVQSEVMHPFDVAVTTETLPEEITTHLLDGVDAVHLDSRHTEAAIALAKFANERLEQPHVYIISTMTVV